MVDRFADARSRQAFKEAPKYRAWMQRLRELCEADPYIEEQSGLGGWFTLTRQSVPSSLKMGVVTFLGVLPLTAALPPLFAWLLPAWHAQLANVLVTALIVALLTWPIMPLLTRIFASWLYGKSA